MHGTKEDEAVDACKISHVAESAARNEVPPLASMFSSIHPLRAPRSAGVARRRAVEYLPPRMGQGEARQHRATYRQQGAYARSGRVSPERAHALGRRAVERDEAHVVHVRERVDHLRPERRRSVRRRTRDALVPLARARARARMAPAPAPPLLCHGAWSCRRVRRLLRCRLRELLAPSRRH